MIYQVKLINKQTNKLIMGSLPVGKDPKNFFKIDFKKNYD